MKESSITVSENEGTYMTCVTKDLDTIQPITVEVFDIESGTAQRGQGIKMQMVAFNQESEVTIRSFASWQWSLANRATFCLRKIAFKR